MIKQANHLRQVLVVDDEQYQSRMLGMLLSCRGYDVKSAFSAKEAFERISPDFDIIILDLGLPDIGGLEVCRLIKENERLRHIPIIILSAYDVSHDRLRSFHLGADDFIAKPCEYEELFARMEVALRRNQELQHDHRDHLQSLLKQVLDQEAIDTYYQPIYQLHNLKLLGVEILSRPQIQGMLEEPQNFFRAAMEYGVYPQAELLSWGIALKNIVKSGVQGMIFLNCNPYLIQGEQFDRIMKLVNQCHVDPARIVFEITERNAIPDYKLFSEKVNLYRKQGFQFALDDLGSGYASLEAMVKVHPQYVKIDGELIKNLEHDEYKHSMVEFIVHFCRKHGIRVIGECIETSSDLGAVCNIELDAAQGYYLAKPQNDFNPKTVKQVVNSIHSLIKSNSFSI